MKTGKVNRSRIGVSVQDIGQQLAQTFGLTTPHGALISSVEPQSPGERAGLKPGDVITSVNGSNIDHSYDLPTRDFAVAARAARRSSGFGTTARPPR